MCRSRFTLANNNIIRLSSYLFLSSGEIRRDIDMTDRNPQARISVLISQQTVKE